MSFTSLLQSLDANKDGDIEIVSCAWDGFTCIYDFDSNVVRYQFEERVQAFTADELTVDGQTSPCFVYVTLGGYIAVYTNVHETLRTIPALTAWDVLRGRGLFYVAVAN